MPIGSPDGVVTAQVLLDRLRLGRRLDHDEGLRPCARPSRIELGKRRLERRSRRATVPPTVRTPCSARAHDDRHRGPITRWYRSRIPGTGRSRPCSPSPSSPTSSRAAIARLRLRGDLRADGCSNPPASRSRARSRCSSAARSTTRGVRRAPAASSASSGSASRGRRSGNLVGSWLAYWVGWTGGRPLIDRFGRYLLIRPHEVDRRTTGSSARARPRCSSRRLLPVVRTFISLPAGVARMPFWKFTLYTVLGCLPCVLRADVARARSSARTGTQVEHVLAPIAWMILAAADRAGA